MKIVHVPFCFHPDAVGGTEIYVEALARKQQSSGHDPIVAAPGPENSSYTHGGLRVLRFAVSLKPASVRELYGDGDAVASGAFARILDVERPDAVHLHAFTRGASLRLVRESKRRDIPVIFSYHTPTVSCQRGALLRGGSEVCDGTLDLHTCARCALHGHGMPKPVSAAVGTLPPAFGRMLGKIVDRSVSGGLWTALRMTELVELRHASFRNLMREADHIIALCQWVKDLLFRNGVPEGKVTVSRQGVCRNARRLAISRAASGPLRIAFLGRLDAAKGVHILIEALRAIPDAEVLLDIYGVAQGTAGSAYRDRMLKLAYRDSRITFCDPLSNDEVVERLQDYDALAVPSQWLETGPIVVLEAFAAGIPVIGSDLGGIANWSHTRPTESFWITPRPEPGPRSSCVWRRTAAWP